MKTLIATLACACLMSSAYAQSTAPSGGMPASSGGSMPTTSKSDARRAAAVEKHIADLHSQLQITAAEETQWAAVAKSMRDSAIETDRAIDKREPVASSASALDNLNSYGDIAQAHADGVKRLAAAFAPLYASMSDDQKKVADAVFAHRAHPGKKK
jgi:hypothetical protein